MEFTYKDIIDCMRLNSSTKQNRLRVICFFDSKVKLDIDKHDDLMQTLDLMEKKFKSNWTERNENDSESENRRQTWLQKPFKIQNYIVKSTNKRRRSSHEVSENEERTKRRITEDEVAPIKKEFLNLRLISKAMKLQHSQESEELISNYHDILTNIDKAAAMFIDDKFDYELMQNSCLNIFPKFAEMEKSIIACNPAYNHIKTTPSKLSIKLQVLMSHTAHRIVQMREKEIEKFLDAKDVHGASLVLFSSWGIEVPRDNDTIGTVTTPLRLHLYKHESKIFWINLRPQWIRFCRPVELEFVRGTREAILEKKRDFENDIENLQPIRVGFSNGKSVQVTFKFVMSLMDEKIYEIVNDRCQECCDICESTPEEMTNIENLAMGFQKKQETVIYGISPLKSWIQLLECLLNIAYRIDFRQWEVTDEFRHIFYRRQQIVQERMRNRYQIWLGDDIEALVTGDDCRKAFSNTKLLSEELELNPKLVEKLKNVLVAFTCHQPLDPEMFRAYCYTTYRKFLKFYSWTLIPASLHKILTHGVEILLNTPVPLGVFNYETAPDSRSEFYRRHRELPERIFCRKYDYDFFLDIFDKVMTSSDPYFSSIAMERRRRKNISLQLPTAVEKLLLLKIDCDENEEDENNLVVLDFEEEILNDVATTYQDHLEDEF